MNSSMRRKSCRLSLIHCNKRHATPGEKTFTLVKPDVRKCLDIVCEIQRAIFARQLAMFLYGDKMMKLFKLRLHLFFFKN